MHEIATQPESAATVSTPDQPVLSVEDLRTHFYLDEGTVHAVDGVNLSIPRGQTLGVVGESGCGKSVTGFSIMQLVQPPGRIVSGRIVLHEEHTDPVELTALGPNSRPMRRIRGNKIAMIFQEPMTSLSPVHTVGSQIAEAICLHADKNKAQAKHHAIAMMQRVGIPNAPDRFEAYPHQLSGGLRQRAMIAMALGCEPTLLIADEPTTALDVTIQAQILELMHDLQQEMRMSILLITHDMGVVAQMADQVAVMYRGRVVEHAPVQPIFENPQHPYTQALLRSIPRLTEPRGTELEVIHGSVPDPFAHVPGCAFHPRCPEAVAGKCDTGNKPPLRTVKPGHRSACLLRHEDMR